MDYPVDLSVYLSKCRSRDLSVHPSGNILEGPSGDPARNITMDMSVDLSVDLSVDFHGSEVKALRGHPVW